ncbi:flagellar hook-length control protein FliK [Albimonas sp. CAU 1670]|uniref:flagellar hook-length control protein FliK n=1 Tax=Albimonas sp. CAU 1670 TaxID=3032599 RepID=UPI0023D9B0AE|nr:flagellar hook-length control protein FliK [Albimonas sp. CAU 1670]MDF2235602.1 flagellar hook-length control protein FliK [Albimonas sp. CAU 1670]
MPHLEIPDGASRPPGVPLRDRPGARPDAQSTAQLPASEAAGRASQREPVGRARHEKAEAAPPTPGVAVDFGAAFEASSQPSEGAWPALGPYVAATAVPPRIAIERRTGVAATAFADGTGDETTGSGPAARKGAATNGTTRALAGPAVAGSTGASAAPTGAEVGSRASPAMSPGPTTTFASPPEFFSWQGLGREPSVARDTAAVPSNPVGPATVASGRTTIVEGAGPPPAPMEEQAETAKGSRPEIAPAGARSAPATESRDAVLRSLEATAPPRPDAPIMSAASRAPSPPVQPGLAAATQRFEPDLKPSESRSKREETGEGEPSRRSAVIAAPPPRAGPGFAAVGGSAAATASPPLVTAGPAGMTFSEQQQASRPDASVSGAPALGETEAGPVVTSASGSAPSGQTAPSAPTAAPAPPAAQAVAEQAVRLARRETPGEIEITLDPPELGRVRMSMSRHEHGLVVAIVADRPEVADLLRRHSEMLGQSLADAGHAQVDLQFGQGGDGGRAPADGRVAESGDPAVEPPPPRFGGAAQRGLDLRV